VKGREQLFPESLRVDGTLLLYEANLKRKYGVDWREKHTDVTVARMGDWGVNTSGAWAVDEIPRTRRVPFTLILHSAMSRFGSLGKIPDPFSEAFANSLDRGLGRLAADHADSPWLLGVFIDNELHWEADTTLVREIMKSPPRMPARVAMVEFLRARYGNVEALNNAWAANFEDFAAIAPVTGTADTAAYRNDLNAFLAVFADKYFGLCRAAMNRHFPNHLYLGCRFHIRNGTVRDAASRFCDVISVNVYQHSVEGYSVDADRDRPWLISEFHFGIRDHGSLGVGLAWAANARNQADLVQAYLSEALRHPNLVGAHWFAWGDQAVTGRPDGENFGVGLVSVVDRPVPTLVDAMRKVSQKLFAFRLAGSQGRIGGGEPGDPEADR
jgi:hypothetical protein